MFNLRNSLGMFCRVWKGVENSLQERQETRTQPTHWCQSNPNVSMTWRKMKIPDLVLKASVFPLWRASKPLKFYSVHERKCELHLGLGQRVRIIVSIRKEAWNNDWPFKDSGETFNMLNFCSVNSLHYDANRQVVCMFKPRKTGRHKHLKYAFFLWIFWSRPEHPEAHR